MGKQAQFNRLESLINTVGKPTVNALFPLDYEYYMIALELVDSDGNLVDNLIFPVMPQSITEDERPNTAIKKTAGGITTLDDITFNPRTIQFQGDFGRSFKFLLGQVPLSFKSLRYSRASGVYKREDMPGNLNPARKKNQIFNSKIKTGYGSMKVLESILNKSRGLGPDGKPLFLYLYNPAIGNNYLVKVNAMNFSQNNPDSNMIWRYSFTLTALAPLGAIKDEFAGLVKNLAVDNINKRATNQLGKAKAALSRIVF